MKDKILNYKKLGLIFVFILGMAVSGAIGGLIRSCDMGQLIPLTEMDLKDMGKAEFNIQLSAKDEEFIKDSNGFISPAMGFNHPILTACSSRTAVSASWDFGNVPLYYSNIVWYPDTLLTGSYFFQVEYVQDTYLYEYRDDLTSGPNLSFTDQVAIGKFSPYTYGIPVFYFQVFRQKDFKQSNAWLDVGGRRVKASNLTVWYQDEDIVLVDMTKYTFPQGFDTFLEEYKEQNRHRREDYDYTWLINRNELWRRPPEAIFS